MVNIFVVELEMNIMIVEVNKVKVLVTVPTEYTQEVRDAVCKAGAGIIGEYSYCTTCVKSLGTFMLNGNAKPYIGENNKLNFVEEDKLEVICDIKNAKRVISELRKVHPYDEPAIDVVPLIDEKSLV